MLRFAVKVGLVSGAVYLTAEQGVWKDSETTSKLYATIKKEACPYVKQATAQLPFELPSLPKTDNVFQMGVYYWNSGVKATFQFLLNSPDIAKDWGKTAYNKIEEFVNPPEVPEE